MVHCVIIGTGHAAIAAAAELRKRDPQVQITLVGGEDETPYQRPPLSKDYLAQRIQKDQLWLRPPEWYDEQNINLQLGDRVTEIDRSAQTVRRAKGASITYDRLLITTGAVPNRLPPEIGGHLPNVAVMRDIGDAHQMMAYWNIGTRIVVIGGGYVGLEAAAEAAKKGLDVTVVEAAPRILGRVAAKETADAIRALHAQNNVKILEGAIVERITERDGKAVGVRLGSGEELQAELVLTGIGVTPDTELARSAGIDIGIGILVNDFCQTSDNKIFAAGDCAEFEYRGEPTRLESVQNAHDQGASAAANMLGANEPYRPYPWFWSNQYDLRLQIAGFNRGFDQVVARPGKREGSVSHIYFRSGQMIAADALNDPATYAMIRKLLEADAVVTFDEISSPGFDFRDRVKAL